VRVLQSDSRNEDHIEKKTGAEAEPLSSSLHNQARVTMGQTSRIVTIVNGVEIIEVTVNDQEGDPTATHYQIRGEKYETLRQAMEVAKGIEKE
jgi:hypothetical protein